MSKAIFSTLIIAILTTSGLVSAQTLTNPQLRDIDTLAVSLLNHTKELHDEYHQHLERIRHANKLEADVSALEAIANKIHDHAHNADGGVESVARLRDHTNEFIQLAFRIQRTIELIDPWLRTANSHRGISHLREEARHIVRIVFDIDRFLPVDPNVIDDQAERLDGYVKELHDEYHEHLEGYEYSRHIDRDLEELESNAKHIHDLAHNKTWAQIELRHLLDDIRKISSSTGHIESLLVQQARRGVRTRDWIGIEHTRDAMTDVLACNHLLEHMIRKTDPRLFPTRRQNTNRNNRNLHSVPARDRHNHGGRHYDDHYDHQNYQDQRHDDRHYDDRLHNRIDRIRDNVNGIRSIIGG